MFEVSSADTAVTADMSNIVPEYETIMGEKEIWTSPQMPYNDMPFTSQEQAKGYCNSYAKMIDFSIRRSMSRRSAVTKATNCSLFAASKGLARTEKVPRKLI